MLRVEIAKRKDGAGLLRCTRPDGSITWQKQPQRHAVHFTHHDLTHFAVETALGYQRGFFGLIAEGWEIEDTTGKGARGPLPDEAVEVETLVGLLDAERASLAMWTAAEFLAGTTRPLTRVLDDESLGRVRALRADLFRRWAALPEGGTLSLDFGGAGSGRNGA